SHPHYETAMRSLVLSPMAGVNNRVRNAASSFVADFLPTAQPSWMLSIPVSRRGYSHSPGWTRSRLPVGQTSPRFWLTDWLANSGAASLSQQPATGLAPPSRTYRDSEQPDFPRTGQTQPITRKALLAVERGLAWGRRSVQNATAALHQHRHNETGLKI